jgi:hypothetical protein
MLVRTLLHRLKSDFGEPTQFERQDAYRWEIHVPPPGTQGTLIDIHLCLTLEEQTQKATIWLFDPRAADHNRARYFHIDSERDMAEALEFLRQRVPVASLSPAINAAMSGANGASANGVSANGVMNGSANHSESGSANGSIRAS